MNKKSGGVPIAERWASDGNPFHVVSPAHGKTTNKSASKPKANSKPANNKEKSK